MASKNDTQVTIGGKTYTLSGYESESYLQDVAAYLNAKIEDARADMDFRKLPVDLQNVLLQLNIADDYFKARAEVETMHAEMARQKKDFSDMKHDLVAAQMKLAAARKRLQEAGES